jgi:hypothetical protein
MRGQVQIADDLRTEEAADVGTDAELESGKHLFRHRGPAEDVASLQDQDAFPRTG